MNKESNDDKIHLELTDELKKEGSVSNFFIDDRTNEIVVEFNHKYKKNKVVSPIRKKISSTLDNFKKILEKKGIDKQDIDKLIDSLEIINYEVIVVRILRQNEKTQKNNSENGEELDYSNPLIDEINKLRSENSNLTYEYWKKILTERYSKLREKIEEYFPEMRLPLEFALSIKTILNIKDITLPFFGILFAVPSSIKTQTIELFRKWIYCYYTDKFTAKSFVSHSANIEKDKLEKIDLLPRIKDKLFLTPELAPLFTNKDDDIKEQFGIITRLLDGKGLETESGVHGKRGYHGEYMFSWLGAGVEIPNNIYKFLSTIGFKIYFLRLPRIQVSLDKLVNQITSEKKFAQKFSEIKELLLDYLKWFEICPLFSIENNQNIAKIEWDSSNDDKEVLKHIAELATLLSHLRGSIDVFKSSDSDNNFTMNNEADISIDKTEPNQSSSQPQSWNNKIEFTYGIPIIEIPTRATQQLYNLARGFALSKGRNYITKDDLSLIIKVVFSTASIERVIIFDFLIANKGILTTSQITMTMNVSNHTAKKTMTEFKGLELVTMEKISKNSNSEYLITLKPEFNWFLSDEFKEYREGFKPTDNKEYLNSKKASDKEKSQNDVVSGGIVDTSKEEKTDLEEKNQNIFSSNSKEPEISITEEKDSNNKVISENPSQDDKLINNKLIMEKNGFSINSEYDTKKNNFNSSLMLEQKFPLCSKKKNNHSFVANSQIQAEIKNNEEDINQSSNGGSSIITPSSSSFNNNNNIKSVSKTVADCDFPKNLENQKESLVGLPVLCCLFCNEYKTPIEIDIEIHLSEKHKKELAIKLPIRSRGIKLDDRIAYAIKLMKQDALIKKEVFGN